MAHYVWNESTTQGAVLREVLTALDLVLHKAAVFTALFNQMSDTQVAGMMIFTDGVASATDAVAAAAKGELLSDLGKLLTDTSQTDVNAALKQLLAQFG